MSKKKWIVTVSQNGWEYTGWVKITAESVKKLPNINKHGIDEGKKILADGVEIEFDEPIGDIEKA